MLPARLVPALALAVVAAGCLTVPDVEPAPGASVGDASDPFDLPPFSFSATECSMAGFVAHYPLNGRGYPEKLAEVWTLADIREEIGNPIRDATGFPVTGPLMGNWHMGVTCKSAATTAGDTADFLFGFVGDVVEAPEWDAGGADVHFLMSGFSFLNGTIGDAARAATTADITHTAKVQIDWRVPKELPRSAAYVAFLDAEKGLYESASTLSLYRQAPERTIRLWWQVAADGSKHGAHHHDAGGSITSFGTQEDTVGEFHPIYWDLKVSGGPQYVTPPVDGIEIASHNMFAFEHGPVAGQPCVTNIYEYPSLSMTSGTVVRDVLLTRLWTH